MVVSPEIRKSIGKSIENSCSGYHEKGSWARQIKENRDYSCSINTPTSVGGIIVPASDYRRDMNGPSNTISHVRAATRLTKPGDLVVAHIKPNEDTTHDSLYPGKHSTWEANAVFHRIFVRDLSEDSSDPGCNVWWEVKVPSSLISCKDHPFLFFSEQQRQRVP